MAGMLGTCMVGNVWLNIMPAHHQMVNALAAGETLLMPANVPHAINPLEPFKMLLVMLRNPADAPTRSSTGHPVALCQL